MAAPLTPASERGSHDNDTEDINMDNRLHDVDVAALAARLADGIEDDSLDDVRAALEQGAPVNYLYKVKPTIMLTCTCTSTCILHVYMYEYTCKTVHGRNVKILVNVRSIILCMPIKVVDS